VKPSNVAFTTKDGVYKKDINGSNLGMGITFIPVNENTIHAILSSRELTGGMFTRMFHTNGHGFKHFKLFKHVTGLTGTDIYTYKIDWEGKNQTIVEGYVNFLDSLNKKEEEAKEIKEIETEINDSKQIVNVTESINLTENNESIINESVNNESVANLS
jgi:hypothetical protein